MDQLLALRVFIRIAEAGSFSKAVDSLNIPRPTATKLIQGLEAHPGAKSAKLRVFVDWTIEVSSSWS